MFFGGGAAIIEGMQNILRLLPLCTQNEWLISEYVYNNRMIDVLVILDGRAVTRPDKCHSVSEAG